MPFWSALFALGAKLFTTKMIIAAVTVLASVAYQRYQMRKAERKAKEAADKAKGFRISTENEVGNVPVVYGRQKIAGFRVLHKVKRDYQHDDGTDLVFLSSGDPREVNTLRLNSPISGNAFDATLYDDGGTYLADSPTGDWPAGSSHTEVIAATTISRTSVTSDYTVDAEAGESAFLKVGVHVTVTHEVMNHQPYWLDDEETEPGPQPVTYTVKAYDNATGLLTLDNPATQSEAVVNAGKAALGANVGNTKREFLFVQQVICHEGVNQVYAVDLDDKDWRDPVFAESARIHVYRDGGRDAMAELNNVVSATATFPETTYASMVFRLNRDEPQYSGVPNVTFYVEGMKVRGVDVGGNLTAAAYTNNPAYCLLDYLTHDRYGLGLDPAKIDLHSFRKAAEICDEVVKPTAPTFGKFWLEKDREEAGPGTKPVKRYECNLVVDTADTVRDNIDSILNTMDDAELIWSEGTYKLRLSHPSLWDAAVTYGVGDIVQHTAAGQVDLYRALTGSTNVAPDTSVGVDWETGPDDENLVVAYVTDDDILLESEISQSWPSAENRLNHCTVRYSDESLDFDENTVSWPPKYQGPGSVYETYLADDNGLLLETEFFGNGVTTKYHAQAMAESRVRLSRNNLVYKLVLSRKFVVLEPGDLIKVTSTLLQIGGELLRILEVEVSENGSLEVSAFKFDAAVLAWNADDDEVVVGRDVYSSRIRQATNLVFDPSSAVKNLSSGVLTWDLALDHRVVQYAVFIAFGPAGSQGVTTTWKLLGRTTDNEFELDYYTPGVYTLTVVSITETDRQAPVLDLLTGDQWPKLTVTLSAQSLGSSSTVLYIYQRSDSDLTQSTPTGGSFDFVTGLLTGRPAGWHSVLADAEAAHPTCDMYYTYALVSANAPVTVVDPVVWEKPQLYSPDVSSINLAAYHMYNPGMEYLLLDTGGPDRLWLDAGGPDFLGLISGVGVEPLAPDVGSGSYVFPSGTFTPPTGNVTWSATEPVGPGTLYETTAVATRLGLCGINTNTLTWTKPRPPSVQGADGDPGDPGVMSEELRIYKWSVSEPSIPAVADTYTTDWTWASGAHGNMSAALSTAGWSLDFPTYGGFTGSSLWIAVKTITANAGTITTEADWSTGVTMHWGDTSNVLGGKKAEAVAYNWDFTIPAGPTGTGTYTWASGTVDAVGGGWQLDASGGSAGQTLWQAYVEVMDANAATTTTVNWVEAGIRPVGVYGEQGTPGASYYTWIKYADTPTSGISDLPEGKSYIGLAYNKTTPTESNVYGDYEWSRVGQDGVDGVSLYTWIKYADDVNGNNMSNDPTGKDYLGISYNQTNPIESNDPADYSWSLYRGADGVAGVNGTSYYTWIKYADTPTTGMSDLPENKQYIGIAHNKTTQTESNVYGDYSWSRMGEDGVDGVSLYTWVRYADDVNGTNMSNVPTGKDYLGLSYNQVSPVESNDPLDYTWSLYKGSDGVNGPAGTSYYTWVKYADTPTSGMSDDPTGKTYIGLAHNKTTPTESSTYGDYSWSYTGQDGIDGIDGETTYTWIKYADDVNGTGITNDPTGKYYIGLAYNKTTAVESNNPADYTWSLYRGSDGVDGGTGPAGVAGAEARHAYAKSTLAVNNDLNDHVRIGDLLPSTTAWDLNTTWYLSPPTLAINQYLWVADGAYDPVGNTTTWTPPYWSSLKVGQLSAISGNIGTISGTSAITLNTASYINAGQTGYNTGTGFWMGRSGGLWRFSMGNGVGKRMYFDGTDVYFEGKLTANAVSIVDTLHIAGNAVTLPLSSTHTIATVNNPGWVNGATLTVNTTAIGMQPLPINVFADLDGLAKFKLDMPNFGTYTYTCQFEYTALDDTQAEECENWLHGRVLRNGAVFIAPSLIYYWRSPYTFSGQCGNQDPTNITSTLTLLISQR